MDDPAKEQQEPNGSQKNKRSLRRYDPDQVMGIRAGARLSAAAHSRFVQFHCSAPEFAGQAVWCYNIGVTVKISPGRPPMKPLVLFDMDGTLLDSVPTIALCCNRALAENGLPRHPIPKYNSMVGWGMRRLITLACPEGSGEQTLAKVMAAYDRIYTEECHQKGILYPGVEQLLRRLRQKGVLTAVITNKPQRQADALYRSTFSGLLDAVWGQREGMPLKPDPTLARALIESLEGRAAAYVGDSPVDIALGAHLGLPTILMTWGSKTAEELRAADPNAVLADSAEELQRLLETHLSAG